MSEIIVVALLITLVAIGFVIWRMVDEVDIPNVAVMFGSPIIGIAVLYWYGTPLGWVFGVCLFVGYLKFRGGEATSKRHPVWKVAGSRSCRQKRLTTWRR
jgi:hypothetical protein